MQQNEIKVLTGDALQSSVCVVVGTRPGIVMFAPIIHELARQNVPHFVLHTGQHYSPNMDTQLFDNLQLPQPKYKLTGVSAKRTHAGQTSVMMEGIEEILFQEQPQIVMVGGDANTNLAGALAARKLRIEVAHLEAGERSYDWRMPEEHNRRIIDHVSDYLFTTNEKGKQLLAKESVQGEVYVTGNPIVDASIQQMELAKAQSTAMERLQLTPNTYGVMTMHREENVDFPDLLWSALQGVSQVAVENDLPIVFLAHPRTVKRLGEFNLNEKVAELPGLTVCEAMDYLDFLNVLGHARLVLTDSGGVQQEACIHHVPAVTLRENTEWVETLEDGANRLAGTDIARIRAAAKEALSVNREWPIPFGDGTTAKQVTKLLQGFLARRGDDMGTFSKAG